MFPLKKILLILSCLFGLMQLLHATDYFWVGGNGNWSDINHWATSSGGSVKHIQTPTPSDNVYFDQNSTINTSLNVQLNSPSIQCLNLDLSAVSVPVYISGVCTDINIFAGLKFTNLLHLQIIGNINFESGFTGNQIYFNSYVLTNLSLNFKGSGSWIIMDNMVSNSNIVIDRGSLYFQCSNLIAKDLISSSSYLKNLYLNSTQLEIENWLVRGSNFNLYAGSSTIILAKDLIHSISSSHYFYDLITLSHAIIVDSIGSLSFHNVECIDSAKFLSNCTFNILKLSKAREYQFKGGTTQTIVSNLVAEGDCSNLIKIYSDSAIFTFSKSSGTIQVSNVCLKNSATTGGASFIATSVLDSGGNSGWQIQPFIARNLYWVGGYGDWSDSTHWSLTNGGVGGECIPQLVDNVYFTDLSFLTNDDSVTIWKKDAFCHNIIWNCTKTPYFHYPVERTLNISGSLSLCQSVRLSFLGEMRFVSNLPIETIQSAGNKIPGSIRFYGNGSWTLLDSLNVFQNYIYLDKGSFITNNKFVLSNGFKSTTYSNRILNLGSSVWEIQNSDFVVNQSNLVLNSGTSLIRFKGSIAGFKTENLPFVSFYNIQFTDSFERGYFESHYTKFHKLTFLGNGEIVKYATIDSLVLTKGKDYILDGKDTIVQSIEAQGSCSKYITLRSKNPDDTASLVKVNGALNVTFCHLRGIYANTPVLSQAINSGDLGMNNGWAFSNSNGVLYWINGTGNWDDTNHWSFNSGGMPSGCVPNSSTDVIFDLNSFITNSDTVYFNKTNAVHHSMTWSNSITQNPVFFNDKKSLQIITGNLRFTQNMKYYHKGITYFYGSYESKYIEMNSQKFNRKIVFGDSCIWSLNDSLYVGDTIEFYKGKIIASGNVLLCGDFFCKSDDWKILDITNSKIRLNFQKKDISTFSWIQNNKTDIIETNSIIEFQNKEMLLNSYGNQLVTFHNVSFGNSGTGKIMPSLNQIFNYNKLVFLRDGEIFGENHMDTLIFSKGGKYVSESSKHQYINQYWQANGDCYGKISLKSNTTIQSYFHKSNGNVVFNFVELYGIQAVGSVSFTDFDGFDLGNNSNWVINPNTGKDIFWVHGGGNWNDTAHWSYSSGGISGACIPTFRDNVFFDNNSFTAANQNVSVLEYSECKDMKWNGVGYFPKFTIVGQNPIMFVFGSLYLDPAMQTDIFQMCFVSKVSGNSITTSGHDLTRTWFADYGGWTVTDTLICSEVIDLCKGDLNFGTAYIETKRLKSNDLRNRTLNLASSKVKIYNEVNLVSDSLVVIPGNSLLSFYPPQTGFQHNFFITGSTNLSFNNIEFPQYRSGLSMLNFTGGGKHSFNSLSISNDAVILGENIFDSLIFYSGNTYKLESFKTQTINNFWYLRGSNCYSLNLESTIKNSAAYVVKTSGNVSGDFINMRDIYASGGAAFYAGAFSTNIINNQGWIFANGPQYVYGLGNDTSFQIGGNLTLSTINFNGGNSTSYLWSNGAIGSSILVDSVGIYTVTVTYDSGCIIVDSIYVGCNVNPGFSVTDNPCFGDSSGSVSVFIPSSNYPYYYTWSSGESVSLIKNKAAGSYILRLDVDTLCYSIDTVVIQQPPPVVSPFNDTSFCETDSLLLNPGNNFSDIRWFDGFVGLSRWISNPVIISIQVKDLNGCWSETDTFFVAKDSMISLNLGIDTSLCFGQIMTLIPDKTYQNYLWNDNSQNASITINTSGLYWLEVSNGVCKARDSIQIIDCQPLLNFPNVFTPNEDGTNDTFGPIEYQNVVSYTLEIFNRWGDLIFSTSEITESWNGEIDGLKAAEGVYFFSVKYTLYNGKPNQNYLYQKGNFTLISK